MRRSAHFGVVPVAVSRETVPALVIVPPPLSSSASVFKTRRRSLASIVIRLTLTVSDPAGMMTVLAVGEPPSMIACDVLPGTTAGDQLLATVQLPAAGPTHVTAVSAR